MDFLLKYYPILVLIWSCIFTIIGFVLHRTYAKRDDHIKLENKVEIIDQKVKELPNKTELHVLNMKIEALSGDIKAIQPGLSSITNLSNMLVENELIKSREK